MEKITLVNTGLDVWPSAVKLGDHTATVTVPIGGQVTLFADEVEHSSIFQEIGASSQYVRGDMPRAITTEIETPVLGAYLILGAMAAMHVFSLVNPFKVTGT